MVDKRRSKFFKGRFFTVPFDGGTHNFACSVPLYNAVVLKQVTLGWPKAARNEVDPLRTSKAKLLFLFPVGSLRYIFCLIIFGLITGSQGGVLPDSGNGLNTFSLASPLHATHAIHLFCRDVSLCIAFFRD
jgi:hypothetical protein